MPFDNFKTTTKPDAFGRLNFGTSVTDDADGGDGFIGALREAWQSDSPFATYDKEGNNDVFQEVDAPRAVGTSNIGWDEQDHSRPRVIDPLGESFIPRADIAKNKTVNIINDNFGYEVGPNKTNRRRDVAAVETLLHGHGYYDLDKTDGPTGYFSNGLQDAIKNFQQDQGLTKDGYLEPQGETITSLTNNLGDAAAKGLGSLFSSVFDGLKNAVGAATDTIGDAASSVAKGIGDTVDDASDTVRGWFGDDKDNSADKTVTTTGTITHDSTQTTDLPPVGNVQKKDEQPAYEAGGGTKFSIDTSEPSKTSDNLPLAFYDDIADLESKGKYDAVNGTGNKVAVGKYQMRNDALKDAKVIVDGKFNNDDYGVKNLEEFKNNPEAQEKAMRAYMNVLNDQLNSKGAKDYVGQEIVGTYGDPIIINDANLLAAAHKEGAGAVNNYLKYLEDNDWESDVSDLKGEKGRSYQAVETRLREFEPHGIYEVTRKNFEPTTP